MLTITLYGQDVIVTTSDALPPSNKGSLTISIDQSLNNYLPFDVSVNQTNGSYTYNTILNSYSLTVSPLDPGTYCMTIESSTNCSVNLCVEIESCYEIYPKNYLYCFEDELPKPSLPVADIIVLGELDGTGSTGTGASILSTEDFRYYWFERFDIEQSTTFFGSSLMFDLADTTESLLGTIINTGSTPYDTTYMSFLDNTDYLFAISYDTLKNINWVWHSLPQYNGENGLLSDASLKYSESAFKIFPNPVSDVLNVVFEKHENGELQIFDINSKLITSLTIVNTPTLNLDVSAYPGGVYFLRFNTEDRDDIIQKFIVME